MKVYSNDLASLQDMREDAHGEELKSIQAKIDNYFFKDPPKQGRKKKKKIRISNPDDMWW